MAGDVVDVSENPSSAGQWRAVDYDDGGEDDDNDDTRARIGS